MRRRYRHHRSRKATKVASATPGSISYSSDAESRMNLYNLKAADLGITDRIIRLEDVDQYILDNNVLKITPAALELIEFHGLKKAQLIAEGTGVGNAVRKEDVERVHQKLAASEEE